MIAELKKDLVYKTSRLRIRKLDHSDFDRFHEMQSDLEVMIYATGSAQSLEENKADLEKVIKAYTKQQNTFWVWAIVDLEDNFKGTIALLKDQENNWEIGYRLLRSEWYKGYASEALEGLINLTNSIPDIQNLVALADRRNIASQAVLNKTGFINLGISYNDTEKSEEYMYSINTN